MKTLVALTIIFRMRRTVVGFGSVVRHVEDFFAEETLFVGGESVIGWGYKFVLRWNGFTLLVLGVFLSKITSKAKPFS